MTKARVFNLALLASVLICCAVWLVGMMRRSSSTENLSGRFESNRAFKGQIVVTLIERKTGAEKKLEFWIDLDRGEIVPRSPQFEGPLSAGGRIDNCRLKEVEVLAPNGELVAHCTVEGGIRILKQIANQPVRQWSANKGWDVCGLVWSLDSKSLAVLLEEERKDLGPLGLLSAASGHPIPLETFEVTVLSAQTESDLRLPVIRRDSPSGWARVDWIR